MSWQSPEARQIVRPFALANGVNAIGTGIYYPFTLLFLYSQMDISLAGVGAVVTFAGLGALLAVPMTGRAVDFFGARPALIVAALARAAALLGCVVVGQTWVFVLFAGVIALGNRVEQAAIPALLLGVPDESDGQRLIALSRAMFNAGFGIGGAIAGLTLMMSSSAYTAFAVLNAASFVIAALLYGFVHVPRVMPQGRVLAPAQPWRDRPYVLMVFLTGLMWLIAMVVETFLPVYVVHNLAWPSWVVSALFLINTILLALLQIPISDRTRSLQPLRIVAVGCLLQLPLFAALSIAGAPGWLGVAAGAVGMVCYSVGEILVSLGGVAAVSSLCPPEARGRYLSAQQVVLGVASAVAPAAAGLAADSFPVAAWGGLAALTVVAALAAVGLRPSPKVPHPSPAIEGAR